MSNTEPENMLSIVDSYIEQLDLSTSHDSDDPLVWNQVRDKFTDRYLYDKENECIGQVNIEKTHSNTINVSIIIDSKTIKMNYQSFKTWLQKDSYEVGELVV